MGWPAPLDAPLRAPPAHHHLVREHARLGHDQHVQRVAQVVMVHDRVIGWVRALEGDAAAAPLVEEQVAHGEGVLPVDGEVFVLFGPAVEFGVPELDVGLRGKETHRVAAFGARGGGPEGGVLEAVIETGVGEDACGIVLEGREGEKAWDCTEGECAEEACFLLLVELVGRRDGVIVVGKVVVCELRFRDFVEDKDKLTAGLVVASGGGGIPLFLVRTQ